MFVNCSQCGYEFKKGDTKNIVDAELIEVSITAQGFDPAFAVRKVHCDNCYNTPLCPDCDPNNHGEDYEEICPKCKKSWTTEPDYDGD